MLPIAVIVLAFLIGLKVMGLLAVSWWFIAAIPLLMFLFWFVLTVIFVAFFTSVVFSARR